MELLAGSSCRATILKILTQNMNQIFKLCAEQHPLAWRQNLYLKIAWLLTYSSFKKGRNGEWTRMSDCSGGGCNPQKWRFRPEVLEFSANFLFSSALAESSSIGQYRYGDTLSRLISTMRSQATGSCLSVQSWGGECWCGVLVVSWH